MMRLRTLVRGLIVGTLKGYKRIVSPHLPPACRFHPTCSDYAAEAFQTLPLWRAAGLTLWRLVRCAPWSAGGFDPVPVPPGERQHDETPPHRPSPVNDTSGRVETVEKESPNP